MDAQLITAPFHGATLYVVSHQSQPYVPMKPIVEGMGMDWASQFTKLTGNGSRWSVVEITTVAEDGKQRAMICLPLRKLPGWLMTIHPNKIKDLGVRAKVIAYQNECDDVLWQHWSQHQAVTSAPTFTPAVSHLTPEQLVRIDQRAWVLSGRAFETYRQQMRTCHYIERDLIEIERWLPPQLTAEIIDRVGFLAKLCNDYATRFNEGAKSLSSMADVASPH